MKKIAVLIGILLPLLFLLPYAFNSVKNKVKEDIAQPVHSTLSPTLSPTLSVRKNATERTSLFVPYWTLPKRAIDEENIDQLIYFGITPDKEGINTNDAGYINLSKFSRVANGADSLLTLRMLDSTTNLAILKDTKLAQQVISQTITTAKQNDFSGIVLDLELSALPFDSTITRINNFIAEMHKQAKSSNLSFSVLLYGDTFFRIRPFDVKTIAKNTDRVMVMAYDFHKARGNPGPNFPLDGRESYGYDFKKMVDDYLRFVPAEKLTVVFGLFGYNWMVDEKQKTVGTGESISYSKIQADFLTDCQYKDCFVSRDSTSEETKIAYTDKDDKPHIVWFEDPVSVKKKQEYLKIRGINSYSIWAYSYY